MCMFKVSLEILLIKFGNYCFRVYGIYYHSMQVTDFGLQNLKMPRTRNARRSFPIQNLWKYRSI